ncbi:MAG: hypothetical protein ACYDC9_09035, partial [Dermatophilaceae bacterium]
ARLKSYLEGQLLELDHTGADKSAVQGDGSNQGSRDGGQSEGGQSDGGQSEGGQSDGGHQHGGRDSHRS